MSKIVLVIPTLMQGGAERVISILANEWAKKGHEVTLVLLVKSSKFYELDQRVNCVQFDLDVTHGTFKKALGYGKLLLQIRKQIKKCKPDFVLSFLDQYNILTLLATRFLKVKVFISDRANPYEKIAGSIEFLKKKVYKFSDGIIAQTSLAKEVLSAKTKHKNIRIIPNPVFIHTVNNKVEKENIILSVGRLVREKAQHFLLDMISEIDEPGWKLVILGDGPLRDQLEEKIKHLNIADKVILKGQVSEVGEWLEKSSIFVFSSISEGFPNALVEAMAVGLPCVSFDCDAGPKDVIINNQNGILIPVGDVEALTRNVTDLIRNKNLRTSISEEALKIGADLNASEIAQKYFNFCTK